MKKTIFLVLTILLVTAQAFALNEGSFEIKVTINKGPEIEGLCPKDGHTITEGDTLEVFVEASDPNSDILEYQFYIKGEVKQPWTTENSFSYTLTADDIGLNDIKVGVTDGMETVETDTVEIYVFRKSPDLPL